MATRTIRQVVTFRASPHQVYEMLMDSRKHARLTGSPASVSRRVGGKFTVYGGDLHGTNLELAPDQRVVQSWRADMDGWPKDHYSRATFSLKETEGNTRLTFTQSGVPEECYDAIKQGWYDYYWTPMQKLFGA